MAQANSRKRWIYYIIHGFTSHRADDQGMSAGYFTVWSAFELALVWLFTVLSRFVVGSLVCSSLGLSAGKVAPAAVWVSQACAILAIPYPLR